MKWFLPGLLILFCACSLISSGKNWETHPTLPAPASGPQGASKIPLIQTEEVKRRIVYQEPVLILDVRSKEEFKKARIPRAVNVPLAELDKRLSEIPKDKDVVCYCGGGDCPLSRLAVQKLLQLGYTKVFEMPGGMEEWIQKGYPVEKQ